MTKTYESEVKIEIPLQDREEVIGRLLEAGFKKQNFHELIDYYLEKSQSPYGGWDFVRLRETKYGVKVTHKEWQHDDQGSLLRMEDEKEVSPREKERYLRSGFIVKLQKTRINYIGNVDDLSVITSLDEVQIDGVTRVFVECECMTSAEEAARTRYQLKKWMEDTLQLKGDEAMSMLELALGG